MTERLIIEARDGIDMKEALREAFAVVCMGRISDHDSYCAVTVMGSGNNIAAFKNKKTDRLVVWKPKP